MHRIAVAAGGALLLAIVRGAHGARGVAVEGGSALDQARAVANARGGLTAGSAEAGEYEDHEWWSTHDALFAAAWKEWGPLDPAAYVQRRRHCARTVVRPSTNTI